MNIKFQGGYLNEAESRPSIALWSPQSYGIFVTTLDRRNQWLWAMYPHTIRIENGKREQRRA